MTVDFQLGRPAGDARIVVAMSGGVDSSVTAALAAQTGAEVIGVTLQLYDHGEAVRRSGACCAGQDIYDAKTVADRLGIAALRARLRKPLPRRGDRPLRRRICARAARRCPARSCNQGVKFVDLIAFARELGADCLATGHYVRRVVNGGPRRAAQGRRSAPRPELFPLRHDARAARFPALPAGRPAQGRSAAASRPSSAWRSPPSPTARTSASCPTAIMPGWSSACAPKPKRRARSSTSTAACSAAIAAWSISPSASAAGSRSAARASRSTSSASSPRRARIVVGPRRALAVEAMRVAEWNWLGEDQREVERQGALARAARSRRSATATGVRFARPNMASRRARRRLLYDGTRLLGGGSIAETACGRQSAVDAAAA